MCWDLFVVSCPTPTWLALQPFSGLSALGRQNGVELYEQTHCSLLTVSVIPLHPASGSIRPTRCRGELGVLRCRRQQVCHFSQPHRPRCLDTSISCSMLPAIYCGLVTASQRFATTKNIFGTVRRNVPEQMQPPYPNLCMHAWPDPNRETRHHARSHCVSLHQYRK